jgi:hypothetical protein
LGLNYHRAAQDLLGDIRSFGASGGPIPAALVGRWRYHSCYGVQLVVGLSQRVVYLTPRLTTQILQKGTFPKKTGAPVALERLPCKLSVILVDDRNRQRRGFRHGARPRSRGSRNTDGVGSRLGVAGVIA